MNIFTLTGEVLLRGTDEVIAQIRQITNISESNSSKMENAFERVGEAVKENFKAEEPKKLKTALETLNDTVNSQKSKLNELKTKYQDLYLTQGKNSKEAKQTAKEIEDLSEELNQNERELKEAKLASDKFGDSLDNLERDADSAESKLSTTFKRIGGVLAGAFAIDKIKDFGSQLVGASAEVSAEMSAFDQIMRGENSDGSEYSYLEEAKKKLEEVGLQTGVISTRLTGSMTSLTAKFKGLGFDIQDATDMAQRGLYLASDASAFWDMSLDESMSHLNSFINGSYEGGEAIGLFANDTQMAQYAVQNSIVQSTKDWANLDEATKQATRLEYAENMMKASGATGQANKEAGQYANTQGNLNEKWRQFKAEIGEPILQNIVTPAMGKLSELIDVLSVKYKEVTQWISENKETINQWVDVLIIASTMIGTYVLVAGTMSILKTIKTWITSVATAQKLLNLVMGMNPIALVITAIAGLVVAFITLWNKSEAFRNFWKGLWTAIKNEVTPVVNDIKVIFTQLWTGIKAVWNAVSPYFKRLWNSILSNAKVYIAPIVTTFKLAWNNIKVVWSVVVAYFKTIWNNIKLIFSVVASVLTGDFRGAWNGIKGIWNNTTSFFRTVWNGIKQIFSNVGSWFKGIFQNAKDAIKRVFVDFPSEMGSIGKDIVKGLWNGINDMTGWIVDKVKGFGGDVLGGIKNFFGIKSPSKVFAEIGKFLAEGLGIGIEDNVDYAIEAVEELGEETTSGFQGMMNKLQNWFSSNPVLRRIGEAFGFEFAEAVESTEEIQEDAGKKIGETIATGIEEGFKADLPKVTEAVESWGDKVLRLTANTAEAQKVTLQNELKELKKLYGDGIGTGKDLNSSYMLMLSQQIAETENKLAQFESTEKSIGERVKEFFSGTFQSIADRISSITSKVMSYMTGITDAMYDYQNQQYQNELNIKEEELESERDKKEEKLSTLKEQYDDGLLTQAEYNTQKKAIENDYTDFEKQKNAEKDAIARKQFEAKKKNDIAQVWVNFASASMRAFAENFWPVALGITSALGVQAGIQTATINSQKYTSAFAEGGIVDRATVGLVGEDGKEAIVPLERNTEWVGGLARAISPAIAGSGSNISLNSLREELVTMRTMLSEYLSLLLGKNTNIILDGNSLAYAITPFIDENLGNINRLKDRGI